MKHNFTVILSLGALLSCPALSEVILKEGFESPEVSGYTDKTAPVGWIGANNGFRANDRGFINSFAAWPATPTFSTPFGEQAYLVNFGNAALTTAQGTVGVLTAGVTYRFSCNVAVRSGTTGGSIVEFVAFEAVDDDTARLEGRGQRPGTVLATANIPVTTSDMSQVATFEYTAQAGDGDLGKDIAIRLKMSGAGVIYDSLRLVAGHDFAPTPADGEFVDAGNVALVWANQAANVGSDVFVDVWFGSDPVSDFTKVESGGLNLSTATVSAPTAGTYYWRIDTYLNGEVSGSPMQGDVFEFTVTDTDGDGFTDEFELANTDPPSPTALDPEGDEDSDNLTNALEAFYGTNLTVDDTDDDDLTDGEEISGAGLRPVTNPLEKDTDGDGLSDGVESNTGTWAGPTNTGTDPTNVDWDRDGLLDGVETNTGIFVDRFNTGTSPFDSDDDDDGVNDWYEVSGSLTNPLDDTSVSPIPYPLPDPDPADVGVSDRPVKVYILSGQSNMVGYGQISGDSRGTLNTITRTENKFPNLLDENGDFLPRQDVYYRGVISATGNGPLAPGFGRGSDSIGPELGFGQVMGWFHDEPVLVIKASIGNRGLQWDFLPPGSEQFDFAGNGNTYPGYGESPRRWATGSTPEPINWYAGKEFDRFFLDKDDWAPAGAGSAQDPNVATVLDNFESEYPQWAAQGFEIAGFGWFHGFDDADGNNGPEAGRYEQNMVRFIKELRSYYENRYPGKVATNAPFVASTYIVGGPGRSARGTEVSDALLNLSGEAGIYPEFAGNVKTVDSLPYWRNADESPASDTIHHRWNAETFMLVGDNLGRGMLTLLDDVAAPSPDPLSFEIAPTAVDATTVGMVAVTASDASGPVEYYFENLTNGDNSGWITETRWDNSGLVSGTQYDFRVRARDAEGNEGDWAETASAAPGNDAIAPTPNPMIFEIAPTALGEDSVTMSAAVASDINGVEYEFVAVGSGNSSGWQASPTYTDTGLVAGTEYTYQVRARDQSSFANATAFSAIGSATTSAPDLVAPVVESYLPAPGATGLAVETTLQVTFDEDVIVGAGLIVLKNLTANSEVTIDVTDVSQVTIAGSVLTIEPGVNFEPGAEIAIQIPVGTITDLVENPFVGISDDTTWTFLIIAPPTAGTLLFEDFESPNVDASAGDGDTNRTLPDNGNWVGADEGFGSNRRGITDKANGDFTADDPNQQAFAFRYTNSGLTTAEGALGVLAAGTTYSVSFDVIRDDGRNAGTPYRARLMAFPAGARRDDARSNPAGSTLLASANGDAPEDGTWDTVSFEFTPAGGEAWIGQDLTLRFLGATSTAIIDNVRVLASGGSGGNDYATWIAGFSEVGTLNGFADDADGDGSANGLENFFGTDPSVASDGLMAMAVSGNTFTFSHPQSETPADDITAIYQWSSDLENFHAAGEDVNGTVISFTPGTVTDGMVSVTATVAGPVPSRLFVNIKVTQTP